jgi:hypothetical protein
VVVAKRYHSRMGVGDFKKVFWVMVVTASYSTLLLSTGCGDQPAFYSNLLKDDQFYQLYDDQQYDFLWILDNANSMASKRAVIANNLQTFISTLNTHKAIDYQMAFGTTDFFSSQGALVASPSGLTVVQSATSTNAIADATSIINNVQDSATSFWEWGLESAYQAISKHGATFSRKGVPLIIVIISDEDDYSCQNNCFGVEPIHNDGWVAFPLTRYVNYFGQVKSPENTTVSLFPIVGTPKSQCALPALGSRYITVAQYLGNLSATGSICDSDIQNSYDSIAKSIANRGTQFVLSNPSDGTNLSVFVNAVQVPVSSDNGWTFDGPSNSINFNGAAIPAKGSVIEVSYTQKHN